MNLRTLFLLALTVATLGRIWVVMASDISPENAKFFLYAEHPAPAYFDGPPGTALMVRAASALGGNWWIALGPLWAAAASIAGWRLGVRLTGEAGGALAALSLNLLPVFNAASLVCGPGVPALALGLTGLCFVWDSARAQHAGAGVWIGWLAAALAFGMAACFSYGFGLAGIFAASTPLWRRASHRPAAIAGLLLVCIAVGLAMTRPLAWNAENDWIPVAGWTLRALIGFDTASIAPGVMNLVLGLSPVFALAIAWAFVHAARKIREDFGMIFVFLSALPGVLGTLLAAYRGWDPAFWALLPTAVLLPPACNAMRRSLPLMAAAMLLAAALCVPVFLSALRTTEQVTTASHHLIELDERLSPNLPGGLFFIASDPDLASALSYHIRNEVIPPEGHPRVYVRESQDISNQFALWPSYDDFIETSTPPDEFFEELTAANPFRGRSAIYVGHEDPASLPQSISSAFTEVEAVQEIDGLYIYLCLDYQTMPL